MFRPSKSMIDIATMAAAIALAIPIALHTAPTKAATFNAQSLDGSGAVSIEARLEKTNRLLADVIKELKDQRADLVREIRDLKTEIRNIRK